MSEPAILTDEQITTSAVFAEGSIRPSEGIPFSTFERHLTVNIDLKNDEYPNAPQLGKVDIVDEVSENIESYEVYYLKVCIPIGILCYLIFPHSHTQSRTQVYTHANTSTYAHKHAHIHKHARTHAHTHTRAHTHTKYAHLPTQHRFHLKNKHNDHQPTHNKLPAHLSKQNHPTTR